LFILSAHYDDVFALTVHMRQHVMDVLGQRYQLHPQSLGSLDISRDLRAGVMDNTNLNLLHMIGQCMDHDTSKYTFALFDKVSCLVLASVYIVVQHLDQSLSSGACKEQFLQSYLLSIMEVRPSIARPSAPLPPHPRAAGDPLARAHRLPHEQLPRRAAQGRLSPTWLTHHARARPRGGAGPDGFDGGLPRDPAPCRAALSDPDQALGPAQEVRRLGARTRHHQAQTRPPTDSRAQVARIKREYTIDRDGAAIDVFRTMQENAIYFHRMLLGDPGYRMLPATRFTDDASLHAPGIGDIQGLAQLAADQRRV
jgi:hypothetical protein